MTNPGDSDEWWKQYGGEGVSPETPPAAPQQPTPPQPPAGYTSAPQYQAPQPYQQYPDYSAPQQNPATGYPAAGSMPGGYGVPGYQPYGYIQPPTGTNGLATASLIVSIVGIPAMIFCGFLPIISLVGLILGIVALNQIKTSQQQGRGVALGGVWVGAVGMVLGIVVFAALLSIGDWSTTP